MEFETFLEHVRRRAGSTREAAREASEVTLEVFGSMLPRKDRRLLAGLLPGELSAAVRTRREVTDMTPDEFYASVDVGDPQTAYNIEHAQAVLETVGEAIDDEMFRRMTHLIHRDFEQLLTPKDVPEAEHVADRIPRDDDDRKLSTGRSGSSRPLSESKGHVHRHSVAAGGQPGGERQLSTRKGPSPERGLAEDEQSATGTGQPPPQGPVVESDED
jgi:uncharacterized protein (DUF2267 family)